MKDTQINCFLEDAESARLFHQERVILDVTERICQEMEDHNMNRIQLAAALGTSKGYVSQLLNGAANMTLRTMSDVFLALGLSAHVSARPIYSCIAPRLTLVHDDEVDWTRKWKNQPASDAPPPACSGPVGNFDCEDIAA